MVGQCHCQSRQLHDPRIFGTSEVGSEPVPTPTDPYAHLKKAWAEGKRIREKSRYITGPWHSKTDNIKLYFTWFLAPEDYEIEPEPETPFVFMGGKPVTWTAQQIFDHYNSTTPWIKPPLGLTPSFVVQSRRISEIMRAIIRYEDAGEPILKEWFSELHELIGKGEVKS